MVKSSSAASFCGLKKMNSFRVDQLVLLAFSTFLQGGHPAIPL
jgi:hypothetical protein